MIEWLHLFVMFCVGYLLKDFGRWIQGRWYTHKKRKYNIESDQREAGLTKEEELAIEYLHKLVTTGQNHTQLFTQLTMYYADLVLLERNTPLGKAVQDKMDSLGRP